jgi:hypothetical protein
MNITTPHKQQQTQEIIPQKKRSDVNEKSIQRRQDWKSGKPKTGGMQEEKEGGKQYVTSICKE